MLTNFSDLTVCHIVLCNLPDVYMAVEEMTRITKNGGIVCAIEPCGGAVEYFPDSKLTEIKKKASNAFRKGVWDLRTKLMDYSKSLGTNKLVTPKSSISAD